LEAADACGLEDQSSGCFYFQTAVSQLLYTSFSRILIHSSLVAVATVHSRYITILPSSNLSLAIITVLTIEQAGLAYSLISATIPNLKSFLMSFDTAMMMDVSHKLSSSDHSATTAQDRFGSVGTRPRRRSDDIHDFYIGSLRPERFEHVANIHHTKTRSTCKDDVSDAPASGSRESQDGDRTIRRNMQWTVEEAFAEASRL